MGRLRMGRGQSIRSSDTYTVSVLTDPDNSSTPARSTGFSFRKGTANPEDERYLVYTNTFY
jgi:hypothetical protein